MSEMIDLVARAIFAHDVGPDERRIARAAIEAMREPSQAVREQGQWCYAILVAAERITVDEDMSDSAMDTIWGAMIDEALK